ncbi:hypothetical protein ACJMK2_037686 [Sinanodonta woodiana]|uniref:BTB domain-containing protein n=1 Tax=Sinanodonta woodiana TaxID=1069815 RepID=A0ABD3WMK1_SINWO
MSHYMKTERRQFSKSPYEYLIKPLLRQRDTGELCDVVLRLNGRKYNAHRAILAVWSPYFLSMFTCDMRERETKEIDLTESVVIEDDEVLNLIITYMYTGTLTLTAANIEDIIRISDFFLMDDVKDYCRQFLDLGNLDLSNCLRLRFLSENHNLLEVANSCQQMIESRFHDYLIYHDEILELPGTCLFNLLEDSRVVKHTSYNELKKLTQRWLDYDPEARHKYQADLQTCIKLWVFDHVEENSIAKNDMNSSSVIMEPTSQVTNGNVPLSVSCFEMFSCNSLHKKKLMGDITEVLFTAVCNPGMKFIKLCVYSLADHKWYHFPLSGEEIAQMIPTRQAISTMIANKNMLFLYLCSSFPYPTDMLKISILSVDLVKCQTSLHSFQTIDSYNPCYRTTLTNCRTVPPAIVYCSHSLYVVGNKEGTGHLFLCNFDNHHYTCYQIPGSRFISLARAAVMDDRFIFLWYRYRTGPSEEFSIKKSVGFAMFDVKTKTFNAVEIVPPDINYDDFAKPYTLCIRDGTLLIYYPGKSALVLDEVRCKWIISLRKMPALRTTMDENSDTAAYGCHLQAPTEHSIFMLNNEAPFTTSMYEVQEAYPYALSHTPPPIDNMSLVTSGYISTSSLLRYEAFERYDEIYTSALHVIMRVSDPETEESGATSNSEEHDSDNDYEYDEDIYDYDYDLDADFSF